MVGRPERRGRTPEGDFAHPRRPRSPPARRPLRSQEARPRHHAPGNGFNFDAVPAFNPEDGSGWIHIADTEDDQWEPSNTYILIDTIIERNKQCDGKFVRQVRMAKQAVHTPGSPTCSPACTSRPSPTTRCPPLLITPTPSRPRWQWVPNSSVAHTSTPPVPTRFPPDSPAAAVASAKSGMQRLADRAAEAQRLAAAGNEIAAAHIWAEIFGDPFPHPRADEKARLQGLNTGAGVAATGAAAARRTPTTRAWRP